MDIKKGLSYVAFGFMFTLINVNFTFESGTVNLMPDFVGWILFFLAYDKLGTYVSDKQYLKWLSLVLACVNGAVWAAELFNPELNLGILNTVVGACQAFYMFMLFEALINIAGDFNSVRTEKLNTLRYFNLCIVIVLPVLGFLAEQFLLKDGTINPSAALTVGAISLIGFVAAFITMFTLFGLKKEIAARG